MPKTTSEKELTITVAFRLPISDYQQVQRLVQTEGVTMSKIMRRLVRKGLATPKTATVIQSAGVIEQDANVVGIKIDRFG